MHRIEYPKLQNTHKYYFSKCQFLKRTLQFVLSISIFSLFVWYSSGFYIIPSSFSAYFSTFLFSFFIHTFERKCMFLICNGILAFLASTSFLSSSSATHVSAALDQECLAESRELPVVSYYEEGIGVPIEFPINIGSSDIVLSHTPEEAVSNFEEEEEGYGKEGAASEAEEKEDVTLYTEKDEDENQKEASIINELEGSGGEGVPVNQEDEAAAARTTENEESVSTEELNRKFEEFIRKMKEEIRIEAQTQLITV